MPKKAQNKRFQFNKNRKRQWKNSKKLPDIKCDHIKAAWDPHKSTEKNLAEMGLSADPNKTLRIHNTKDAVVSEVTMEELQALRKQHKKPSSKSKVVAELEAEANMPRERTMKLSGPETEYTIYMMEKYGEDYKAMAKDRRNYYQDTPKQIRAKINKFKSIPGQYKAYLDSKSQTMETD